jgi:hypothetical protein
MQCQLCQKEKPLRNSHIFPKFIFTWLKNTGNGYLRNVANYNVRIQDGVKMKMLCSDCEQLFSDCETYFAKYIFHPVANDKLSIFEYSEKLYYFIISLVWRVVRLQYLHEVREEPIQQKLIQAEESWRQFLLNSTKIETCADVHLFIAADNVDDENISLPQRFLLYMLRGVDMDMPNTDTDCLLYIKLSRFIFIIPFLGLENERFIKTNIPSGSGLYHCNEAVIESGLILKYLLSRVENINLRRDAMSPGQKQKLQLEVDDNWDKVKDKDLGQVLDYEQRRRS